MDCIQITNRNEQVRMGDILWHIRDKEWHSGERFFEQTWGHIQDNYSRYTVLARSIYSRENPPPPPKGLVYLDPDALTIGAVQQYCVGVGWLGFYGYYTLNNSEGRTLALVAPPDETKPERAPHGFEIIEPDWSEFYSCTTYRVWSQGHWETIGYNGPMAALKGRLIARRLMPVGDLPITLLPISSDTQIGDLVYDNGPRQWMPAIGLEDDDVSDQLGDYYTGMARLEERFRDKPLLSMHEVITRWHEVLIKRDGEWKWVKDHDYTGEIAYMVPEVIALRRGETPSDEKPRIPVASWMDEQLRGILETDAETEVFRGLVRRRYHMNIPEAIHQSGDTAAITRWLEERRAEINPVVDVNEVRVYTKRLEAEHEDAIEVTFHLLLTGNGGRGHVWGQAMVPPEIFDSGEACFHKWLRENFHRFVHNRDGDDVEEVEEMVIENTNYAEVVVARRPAATAMAATEAGQTDEEWEEVDTDNNN